MRTLSEKGKGVVEEIAARHGVQVSTVEHMLDAVRRGGGTMAQFDCAELGGSGQWMRGGMTMVGDMFNHGLKARVERLCDDLGGLIADSQIFEPVGEGSTVNAPGDSAWWPDGLGAPISSGGQNQTRYAVFPGRLAVEEAGRVTVYDTLHHQISGASQQQGGSDSMSFSSQFGTVTLDELPVLSTPPAGSHATPVGETDVVKTGGGRERAVVQTIEAGGAERGDDTSDRAMTPGEGTSQAVDPLSLIEKLARLHAAGVLTDEEFAAKKTELLARL